MATPTLSVLQTVDGDVSAAALLQDACESVVEGHCEPDIYSIPSSQYRGFAYLVMIHRNGTFRLIER